MEPFLSYPYKLSLQKTQQSMAMELSIQSIQKLGSLPPPLAKARGRSTLRSRKCWSKARRSESLGSETLPLGSETGTVLSPSLPCPDYAHELSYGGVWTLKSLWF